MGFFSGGSVVSRRSAFSLRENHLLAAKIGKAFLLMEPETDSKSPSHYAWSGAAQSVQQRCANDYVI